MAPAGARKKGRRSPEHLIQSSFFDEVRLRRRLDKRWSLIFAIPNGEHRHIAAAKRLKAEGVEPGIPDVFVAVPSSGYSGLWLEFKAPGKYPSPEQKGKIEMLREAGYMVEVVRDAEKAIQIVKDYFG